MKRTYPQSISEIIQTMFKERNMESTMMMHKALAAWPEIVGPAINRQTVGRRVDAGTIYVRIPSAVVRQELSMHRSYLINALNTAAGAQVINEIKFV